MTACIALRYVKVRSVGAGKRPTVPMHARSWEQDKHLYARLRPATSEEGRLLAHRV